MHIREADPGDAEPIAQLLSLLFAQEADFSPDVAKQLQGVRTILADPQRGRFLVIEDGGQVVGAVSLQFLVSTALGGRVALMEDMVLAPEARGKGWGTRLLEYAIGHAQDHDCLRITLLTDSDNRVAQSLYAKCGFAHSSMIPMWLLF
jgi:GNAT superfamily N-acetyltransferase